MKTVRFSEVVARSGRPEIHLTWSAPASDRVLQTAARNSRVLTVHQQVRGAKKDFAVVGIEEGRDAQFLVFPKSLRPFVGHRIIGIRYDLLAPALSMGTKGPTVRPTAPKSKPAPVRRSNPKEPIPHSARRSAAPSPELRQKRQSKPIAFEPAEENLDPVKVEIRRALTDLSIGDVAKAKRRLLSLLKP